MSEEQINSNTNKNQIPENLTNLESSVTAETIHAPETIENKQETPANIQEQQEKQTIQEIKQQNLGQGGLGGLSHAQQQHIKHLKEIESIMEKNMEDIYIQMTPSIQKKLKIKGEKIAIKINKLLNQTKVNIKKIIKLIRNWLSIIPGVNNFFLEQSSKIKADEIIKLKEGW